MSIRLIAKRHRPLLTLEKMVLTYHVGGLYLLDPETKETSKVCTLPMKRYHRILVHFRLIERLLRLEVKAAIALSDTEVLISYLGGIFHINLESGEITQEHTYRSGMNNPLYFTRVTGLRGFTDCIAYGEYTINPKRTNPSAIYIRSFSTPDWHKVFEFPAGQIRHIHGLKAAHEDGCVYIMTGDLDKESGIWSSSDGFRTVNPVLVGQQKYRTGFMYSVANGYIYPTDTAMEQNYVYYAEKNEACFNLKTVTELDGSCVNSAETEDEVYIATAVEPDERVTGWRSWINYKKGAGIKSEYSQLLRVNKKSLNCDCLFRAKKDIWPYRLFQYGSMIVVKGPEANSILVYPVGVKKYDGTLFLFNSSSKEGSECPS